MVLDLLTPDATSSDIMPKLTKSRKDYHTSNPQIPGGLVLLKEWAIKHGITPVCAQKWVWAGKLKAYRVPGYGLRNFVKPDDAARCLKPIASVPTIAR